MAATTQLTIGDFERPDLTFFGPAQLPLLDRARRVQRFVPGFAIEVVGPDPTSHLLPGFHLPVERLFETPSAG